MKTPSFPSYLFLIYINSVSSSDHGPPNGFEVACNKHSDCYRMDSNFHCVERTDGKLCRCRKGYSWDAGMQECLRNDDSDSYDPVQNFIIPAIIVMSVGAMLYLGIKLFCNCGKLWRRRRSPLARGIDGMTAPPHQPATWVFSQLSNPNRPPRHSAPCMGVFVPSQAISQSPPPYEEALKHKVILSSYHPSSPGPPAIPLYAYTQQTPVEETSLPVIVSGQGGRIVSLSTGDQMRPLRYYPGEENPQIPAVWNSIRMSEAGEGLVQEIVRTNPITNFREGRGTTRSSRSSQQRYHGGDTPRCLQGESGT